MTFYEIAAVSFMAVVLIRTAASSEFIAIEVDDVMSLGANALLSGVLVASTSSFHIGTWALATVLTHFAMITWLLIQAARIRMTYVKAPR
jgi:hypothetical protein